MINRIYTYNDLNAEQLKSLQSRPKIDFDNIFELVRPIIDDVRTNGDSAVRAYTRKFDGIDVQDLVVCPPTPDSIDLSGPLKNAFKTAYDNIRMFHLAQIPPSVYVETMPGVRCSRHARPIERVGLYIPGGTAILPSSVLMLAIPARLAGCREIVLATPPDKLGQVPPEVMFAASISGISKILLSGGAQAVAALAFGTSSVPKVDKIIGPGNQYVTAAKMLLQNSEAMVSIDMPAGPTEVLVIADHQSNPAYVASDLLSQAEHGTDSQTVLVFAGAGSPDPVLRELKSQLDQLKRKEIAAKAFSNSFIVLTESVEQAIDFSNFYAPEHLIMNFTRANEYTGYITNAGSVFVGPWSPESVGDYASGTNHTLPTYGYARMYGGVSLDSFLKHITFQELSAEGLNILGPHVELLAGAEGLKAHQNAVSIRLKDIS
jgi:histidinol dehydrogenase